MTRSEPFPMPECTTFEGLAAAQHRIDQQEELVAYLQPGTEPHRIAVQVLLLLQDSLVAMIEARAMIQIARTALQTRKASLRHAK